MWRAWRQHPAILGFIIKDKQFLSKAKGGLLKEHRKEDGRRSSGKGGLTAYNMEDQEKQEVVPVTEESIQSFPEA